MNFTFFKALFGIVNMAPSKEKTEVVHNPPKINTSEGGEYLDDNIRMQDSIFSQYPESFKEEDIPN